MVNLWKRHSEFWLQLLARVSKGVHCEICFILYCFIYSSPPKGIVSAAFVGLCGDPKYISMWVQQTGRKEGNFRSYNVQRSDFCVIVEIIERTMKASKKY